MAERVKIKCDDCKFVEDCVDYGWEGCKKFTPKPREPMTEQEYIQTCDTEQLAEEISYLVFGGDFKKHISKMGYINMHSFKTEIVEWLKQPHRDKE